MELTGIGPGREPGDTVEFAKELAYRLTRIFTLAQDFYLGHQPGERVFGLGNRHFRVVLALAFQTRVMFVQFLPEEVGETPARLVPQRDLLTWRNTVR
jgi:hypothetical protein